MMEQPYQRHQLRLKMLGGCPPGALREIRRFHVAPAGVQGQANRPAQRRGQQEVCFLDFVWDFLLQN